LVIPPHARTLGKLLDEMAARYPEREAIIFEDHKITYKEFQQKAESLAKGFLRIGVGKGDRVAILMSNRPEFMFSIFGLAKIGAIFVGVSTWSKSRELSYILRHSDASTLIIMDRFLKNDYAAMLYELCPELQVSKPGELLSERFPFLRRVIFYSSTKYPGTYEFEQLYTLGEGVPVQLVNNAQEEVKPQDTAYILYTSGSTATPKGVILNHRGLIENSFNIGERLHLTEKDRVWIAVPLFWAYGSANAMMATITHGACAVLQEYFEPTKALEILSKEKCTCCYTLPTMTHAMFNHPDRKKYDLSSLRTGITIGSPQIIRMTIEFGIKEICNVYGGTETYGNCTVTDAKEPEDVRINTQGKPLPGVRIKIVDPNTRKPLPPNEVGEICVKGYITGYYKDEDRNATSFDEEGYFITRDSGMLDEEGRMHFKGRLDDMIKVAGINVSPIEVEEFLQTHPKVNLACVIGVPDKVKGQAIVAFLQLKENVVCTEEEIIQFCKQHISSYKVPKYVRFKTSFPLTDTGKIHKNLLRLEAIKELGLEESKEGSTF